MREAFKENKEAEEWIEYKKKKEEKKQDYNVGKIIGKNINDHTEVNSETVKMDKGKYLPQKNKREGRRNRVEGTIKSNKVNKEKKCRKEDTKNI